jgi:succinoglycan biosynthesis transport protein ExoP
MLDSTEGRGPPHLVRPWADGRGDRPHPLPSDVEDFLGVLSRQLWSILLPAILIPALVALALSQVPTLYTATGTVIYDPTGYSADVLRSILKTDPTTDTIVASQAAILGNLSAAHRIATDLNLASVPEFAPRRPVADERLFPNDHSAAVDAAVLRAMSVVPVDASRVFAVSFTAQDPDLAAVAANRIMAIYIADQLSLKTTALRAADAWMDARAAALRAKALEQNAAIARYRQANGLIEGVQAQIGTEEISGLSADLMRAEEELAGAQARRDAAGSGRLSENVVAMRLATVQAQGALDAARARLGPNHPVVRALQQQLAVLRAASGAESADVSAGVNADAQAAATRLSMLRGSLLAAQAQGAKEADAAVALQAMQQDADATRQLLQALLTRMEQSAQQEAIETPDARILSSAAPPTTSSSPKRGLLLAAAVLLGLVAGGGLAWLREVTTTTLRTEREVDDALGLRCLGTIPGVRTGSAEDVQHRLARPGSLAARQVQILRGRLRFAAADPRILAVISTRPGEGKTSLALALARSAARGGESVLVVDCDRVRPHLSRILMAADAPGLTELLSGSRSTREVIRADTVSGLSIIPAGGTTAPTQRLAATALRPMIADWRRDYDLIVLDGAPLLAGVDSLSIAELADAVLLCVRWNHTPRRLLAYARRLLTDQPGSAPLAVVLTRLGARSRALRGFPEAEFSTRRYAAYFRA